MINHIRPVRPEADSPRIHSARFEHFAYLYPCYGRATTRLCPKRMPLISKDKACNETMASGPVRGGGHPDKADSVEGQKQDVGHQSRCRKSVIPRPHASLDSHCVGSEKDHYQRVCYGVNIEAQVEQLRPRLSEDLCKLAVKTPLVNKPIGIGRTRRSKQFLTHDLPSPSHCADASGKSLFKYAEISR